MLSKAKEGVDFFRDGTMFVGRTIYIAQQNRLRERSGFKPMSLHEIPVDEHPGCSRVQEGRGSDGGEGC